MTKDEMTFVSLHHHTTLSYGDGFGTVADHVRTAAGYGMFAMAVSEHGNTVSHPELERTCAREGIKPIFGLEAYTADPKELRKFHQIVLAATQKGYQNLNALVGLSYAEGFYRSATIHPEWWPEHAEGLIITSGCSDSLLSCTLLGGKSMGDKRERATRWDMDACVKVIQQYQEWFGKENYYLECQRFPALDRTCVLNPAWAELSRRTGAPLVATADVHYPRADENEMQKILHAAHRGNKSISQQEAEWEYDIRMSIPTSDVEIGKQLMATGLSRKEAWSAICNTSEIAERCTVVLPKSERLRYPVTAADFRPWTSTGTG